MMTSARGTESGGAPEGRGSATSLGHGPRFCQATWCSLFLATVALCVSSCQGWVVTPVVTSPVKVSGSLGGNSQLRLCRYAVTPRPGAGLRGMNAFEYSRPLSTEGDAGLVEVPQGSSLSIIGCDAEGFQYRVWYDDSGAAHDLKKIQVTPAHGDMAVLQAALETISELPSRAAAERRARETLAKAQRVVSGAPSSARAFTLLALALVASGKHDESLAAFAKAAELAKLDAACDALSSEVWPGRAAALTAYADALRLAGHQQEAIAQYKLSLTAWTALLEESSARDCPSDRLAHAIVSERLGSDATGELSQVIQIGDANANEELLTYTVSNDVHAKLALNAFARARLVLSRNEPYWRLNLAALLARRNQRGASRQSIDVAVVRAADCYCAALPAKLAEAAVRKGCPPQSEIDLQRCSFQGRSAAAETSVGFVQAAWVDWRATMAAAYLGRLEADQLTELMASSSVGLASELLYYEALGQLSRGNAHAARQGLQRVADLGVIHFIEYKMARELLRQLPAGSGR
jgi:hypothetical protein